MFQKKISIIMALILSINYTGGARYMHKWNRYQNGFKPNDVFNGGRLKSKLPFFLKDIGALVIETVMGIRQFT